MRRYFRSVLASRFKRNGNHSTARERTQYKSMLSNLYKKKYPGKKKYYKPRSTYAKYRSKAGLKKKPYRRYKRW